jgi:hypothetical protein
MSAIIDRWAELSSGDDDKDPPDPVVRQCPSLALDNHRHPLTMPRASIRYHGSVMIELTDLVVQVFFGLFVLGGCLWLGYVRWIRPHGAWLDARGIGTLVLISLTLFGGGIGAFGWFADDPRSFAWDLPPLASRMLAAAGWAFAVLSFVAIRRPTWPRVSLVLIALVAYLAPIGAAAVLFHRDRFDASAPITPAFFLIVGSMTLAAIWFLAAPSPALRHRGGTSILESAPLLARVVLITTSTVALPWALALFVSDDGPTRLIWAWPGDLLSSRLIAVMLLTIGIVGTVALRRAESARLVLVMNLTYGVGIIAAGLMNVWLGRPPPLGYMTAFGLIGLLSAAALALRTSSHVETRGS